ncbi:MAG: acyl-CoA dehydrogenase family protein [Anaerolineae bacterium]
MNNSQYARADLKAWESGKFDNFFTADTNLQHVLLYSAGADQYIRMENNLAAFGQDCATHIDKSAKVEDQIGNHPRLQRYNGIGERLEEIEFHPNHDTTGRMIWKSGILALQRTPGHTVHQMALLYLLAHNGEAGHMCSIACTSGLIRALQVAADDALRDKYLPPLLDPNYETMAHGAQFLTEVQGGSDVGANALAAADHGDGTWRLNGEKWFCSNINAQQFLVMARPENSAEGTRGLGLFLVPRTLDDGETNGFHIRRLKDKLGTRTLASAELDFRDAVAYPVGAVDAGFKHTVELVLNTSRLINAVACAGVMRRAYLEAASYACTRQAFGNTIATYPLVQETVADILSEGYAATSSGFALAVLLDRLETGQGSDDDKAVYRMLVNLNKYITSIRGTEVVHKAIEVFGGNGAIESFSILPRLYRDMVVLESWEGTHNVLCLQVLRDIARYNLHEPFLRYIDTRLATVTTAELKPLVGRVQAAMARTTTMLDTIMVGDVLYQQAHARRLADACSHLVQAALLLAEAQWELDNELPTIKPDVITHFVNAHLNPGYDPLADDDYLPRLERLMMSY